MSNISFIKDVKSLKINEEPSHEYELGSDLMRVGGVRQAPRLNNVPAFRDNGYQLELKASNGDYLEVVDPISLVSGDIIRFRFIIPSSDGVNRYFFSEDSFDFRTFISISGSIITTNCTLNQILINGVPVATNTNLYDSIGSIAEIELECVDTRTLGSQLFTNSPSSLFFGATVLDYDIKGESFLLESFEGTIVTGSLGTEMTIFTSHVDGDSYIERDIWQKKSFALVGNGTTEKIVSPLGSELILTSTPLEGGFTLDGKIYDLKEGLGTKILSRDETTESEIVGFTGGSLNYGGWRKGNNVDGWTPYD